MRKMIVVALREYTAAVRTKTFLIGLILMPVLMGGSIVMQVLLKEHDVKDKTFAVIDRSPNGRIADAIKEEMDLHNAHAVDQQTGKQILPLYKIEIDKLPNASPEELDRKRSELRSRMRQGALFGLLVVGPDVFQPPAPAGTEDQQADPDHRRSVVFETNRMAGVELRGSIDRMVNQAVQAERGKKMGLTEAKRKALTQPVNIELKLQATFAVPIVLMMLMFMVLMMVANPLMQGVVEEKMQRIAEVLLGSVSPSMLMGGKLLGMTAVSLTIVAVYLSGGIWAAYYNGFGEYVPSPYVLVWFLVFQTLAALMYGSLFTAIGAACTDMKETQNLLLPVMLICCMPLFLITNLIRDPNSPVVAWLSFFPLATPMLMIARMAVPPGVSSPWQPYVGVAGVLVATSLCVWAAGRIFRVGLLMQGKGANLAEMTRWVVRG